MYCGSYLVVICIFRECYERHLKAICKKFKTCTECSRIYCTEKPHTCGEKFCHICYQTHNKDVGCFITAIEAENKVARIMAFDFEVNVKVFVYGENCFICNI